MPSWSSTAPGAEGVSVKYTFPLQYLLLTAAVGADTHMIGG